MQDFASFESTAGGQKKKKSSSEAPVASGEIGGDVDTGEEAGKEAMEIGADRIGVNPKEEAILKTIAEKEEQRGALLRSWRAKFDKIKELKAAQDKEKELETRLHMNGGISDETFWASSEARAEKIAEAANEAQKDLDLASELREEIEKLRSDLEKGTN